MAAGEGGHRHRPGVPAVQETCNDDDDEDNDDDDNDDDVTAAGHVEAAVAAVLPPVLPAQLSSPLLGQGAALLGIERLYLSCYDGHSIDVIDVIDVIDSVQMLHLLSVPVPRGGGVDGGLPPAAQCPGPG